MIVGPVVAACLALLAAAPLWAQDAEFCLECHGRAEDIADLTADPRPGLVVDGAGFAASVHAFMDCGDCHFDFDDPPHEDEAVTVGCAECHEEVAEALQGSIHAEAMDGAPVSCGACHGVHDVLPSDDRRSRLHPLNVLRTCGSCHFEVDTATADSQQLLTEPLADDSHARGLLESGLVVSASCVSCHGGHEIRAAGDAGSRLAPERIAETCASCHLGIAEQFHQGVHSGISDEDGRRSASCSDCHLPHAITAADTDDFRLAVVRQCGSCHEYEASTYHHTFHGQVSNLGSGSAAKCHDCHGAHGILPPEDPASPLAPANIVATCARCHAGAHESFTRYLPHATASDRERWPWLYWSTLGMTALLVGTMMVALLHTFFFLVRLLLDRKQWLPHKRAARAPNPVGPFYRRFNRAQRTLHLLMVISFLTLALTGMTLKFSHAPWARGLASWLGGSEAMGTLHRTAALLLVAVFIWHVRHALLMKKESGRTWLQVVNGWDSILFNRHDLTEARQTLRWFFGRGRRPRYGRYTYWEKFDYFAVFWGIAIIGFTGFSLWFPVTFTRVMPGWMLNVMAIIHSDEALLASAFIFTVHFFNANLRPDKFPMDMVMFTGRMTLDELKYERPREYEALRDSGRLEEHLVEPLPRAAVRGFRVFAGLALLTGISLVVLIVYALLTG